MLGTITVINGQVDGNKGKGICIMRGYPLGNPFPIDESAGQTREKVVLDYYHYLREEYSKKEKIYNELHGIAQRVISGEHILLRCCCVPKLCHGSIIKKALEGIIQRAIK